MAEVPGIDQLKAQIVGGTPLERLTAASELAEKLRARGDELLDQFVDAARTSGSSWSEIGCSLGTSKQAAQQRFAVLADPPPGEGPFGLVGPTAEVLSVAGEEARALGHHYIRPEHLVLGLLSQPEELAARALADVGVTATVVRAQITAQLGSTAPRPTGSLGVAPQTKRLLEVSRAIAKSLHHNCPRTEHMLLAALSPKLHSPAAVLLAECGTTPEQVRDHLTRMILQQSPELADRLANRSVLSRVHLRSV
jgi:Clp amino terminal domain, pathogenicity island component